MTLIWRGDINSIGAQITIIYHRREAGPYLHHIFHCGVMRVKYSNIIAWRLAGEIIDKARHIASISDARVNILSALATLPLYKYGGRRSSRSWLPLSARIAR